MKNRIFIIMAVINILICTVAYAKEINAELSQNLLRMHIIANSDSEYDQKIKILVRDEITKMFSSTEFKSRADVLESIGAASDRINTFLENKGAGYSCMVSHEKSIFDKKDYENVSMPSGEYECIKVILGAGKGKNWWCIAYPPMCFTKSVIGTADSKINTLLKEETYNIITSQESEYKIKFKIVDMINSITSSL